VKPARLLPMIVACALFVENMDSTVIATSLPAMANDLGTSPIALKLAMTTYLISLAVFIPASAWVADRKGARTTFVAAIVVFLLGSLSCASSSSLATMVAARGLQGAGGAMMVPVGRLVVLRTVPKHELVDALAWITIPALVAPMIGPPLGGFITTYFHWRWIFLLNLPIAVVGVVLAARFIPDLKGDARGFDARGFVFSGVGLGLTLFGLSTFGKHLVSTSLAAACLGAGLLLLLAYGFHARRHPQPLLDLGLLRIKTFRSSVVGGAIFRVGVGATPFLLPMMLQLGFGLSPLQSGLLTFASAIGALFMKTLASRVLQRFGFRRVLVLNAVVASTLLGSYGLFRADTPHAVIIAVLVVAGSVRALQFTSLGAIAYADVDAVRMGQATSLSGMIQQLSLSLGVAAAGYALQLLGALYDRPATSAANFGPAFFAVAFVSLQSVWVFARLGPGDGASLARRQV
jgi:EmrB/QacA subfamily drug resistance transporter